MREFTTSEKEFIKRIVKIHREKGIDSMPELQVAKLLRNDLAFFALKWETKPKPQVTIYKPKGDEYSDQNTELLYFQIADYIYFIEELLELGFIKLQSIPSNNQENFTILYDRAKYKYDTEGDQFLTTKHNWEFLGKKYEGYGVISLEGCRAFHTDFAYDLEKCGLAIIYPLPLAEEYVDNGCKSLEKRQFDQQLDEAKKSVYWSRAAFVVSCATVILTLIFHYCDRNSQQTINESQVEEIISTIKDSEQASSIDIVNISTGKTDTTNLTKVNKQKICSDSLKQQK